MNGPPVAARDTASPALDSLAIPGDQHPEWIWRNGEIVPWTQALIHVNAVGHASTAAIFEGIKAYRARESDEMLVFRLDDHLRRLHDSARICRLTVPYEWQALRTAVLELLRANRYREDAYIRPWAFPSGVIREQMVPGWQPLRGGGGHLAVPQPAVRPPRQPGVGEFLAAGERRLDAASRQGVLELSQRAAGDD